MDFIIDHSIDQCHYSTRCGVSHFIETPYVSTAVCARYFRTSVQALTWFFSFATKNGERRSHYLVGGRPEMVELKHHHVIGRLQLRQRVLHALKEGWYG